MPQYVCCYTGCNVYLDVDLPLDLVFAPWYCPFHRGATAFVCKEPTVPPYPTETIKALEQQVEIAMKALSRICDDLEGEVSKYEDGEVVRWSEEVAREAMRKMRKLNACP